MEDFQFEPNSNRHKAEQKAAAEEKKEIQKVVKGPVKTKKKSEIAKFTDIFIAEDFNTVKKHVFEEVVVPGVKKLLSTMFKTAVDLFFEGSTSSSKSSNSPYVSYRSYSDPRDDRRVSERHSDDRFNYDQLIFESRGDVEKLIREMGYMIDRYGLVTVADLYEMVDKTAPFTANKYGWTSVRNAQAVRVRGGYAIDIPKAMPID